MEKLDLTSLSYDNLESFLSKLGQPKFRAQQLFDWIHNKYCDDFDQMTNLSLSLRSSLKDSASLCSLVLKNQQQSTVDGTTKFLFGLADGDSIETVFMKYSHGNSLCISTQVGCKMGCRFCASTIGGKVRNLSAGEILSQVYFAEKITGEKISNIVLMGIGEPLDNFDNVVDFLNIISNPKGRGLSLRSITLSTCGIVPKITALADLHFPITLAISLHAADDKTRSEIMPINKKYPLNDLIKACKYYFEKTGRRITFEYALISGVNDSMQKANQLSDLLAGINCHINLIPINNVVERDYKKSSNESVKAFALKLEKKGLTVTVRRELGSDISAACGQLRYEESAK